MANKNTQIKHRLARKNKTHFHGKACVTCFASKDKNPENKRKSPYKAGRISNGGREE